MKQPAIYIMASKRNGTIYTGVTSNLSQRVYDHKKGTYKGFSKQYDCKLLVYYESYEDIRDAIGREKQIKSWARKKKLALIESFNPTWRDLYEDFA